MTLPTTSISEYRKLVAPRACVIAVDVSSHWDGSPETNFLDQVRVALHMFGDLLALHPSTSLISLIKVSNKATNLIRMGKLDLIAWRHAITRLDYEPTADGGPAYLDVIEAVRRAKLALPLITNWTLVILSSAILPISSTDNVYQGLLSLDSLGVHLHYILLHKPTALLGTNDDIQNQISSQINQGSLRELEWVSLEVAIKTSFLYAKALRFQFDLEPQLLRYISELVLKLVKHPNSIHRKVRFNISESIWIAMEVLMLRIPRPRLSFAHLIPQLSWTEATSMENSGPEICQMIIGSHAVLSAIRGPCPAFERDEVTLEIVQKMSSDALPEKYIKSNSIEFALGKKYKHDSTLPSKTVERDNRKSFQALRQHLIASDIVIVIATHWDLERLYFDGKDAYDVLLRFYALSPSKNGLLAKELVSYEESLISPEHGQRAVSNLSDEDVSLEGLEIGLALGCIENKPYEPAEMGISTAFEQAVWNASSQSKFSFLPHFRAPQ